ncbi:MAG: hypothetical protein AB7T49_01470 [Oligoflexales bacterium]
MRYYLLFLFGILAFFHVPILEMDGDGIGIFDVVSIPVFLFALYDLQKQRHNLTIAPRDFISVLFFTGFITVCIISFLECLFAGKEIQIFQYALFLKQLQYLMLLLAAWVLVPESRAGRLLFHLSVANIFLLFALALVKVQFTHEWIRLSLPFKSGESPNPAGFILSCSLLFVVFSLYNRSISINPTTKMLIFGTIAAGLIALAYSRSRTNSLALVITTILYLTSKNIGHPKRLISAVVAFCAISLLGWVFYDRFGVSYGEFPLRYLTSPKVLLEDSSFMMRVNETWFRGLSGFRSGYFQMLFGLGLGTIRYNDGLYPALLFGTGVLGALFYICALVLFLLRGSPEFKALLVFILLNGVTVETTLNSFRVMQVILPMVVFLIKEYKHDVRRFRRKPALRERYTLSRLP